MNSPHKRPVTWKMFPFHDVIMGQNKVFNDSWFKHIYFTTIGSQLYNYYSLLWGQLNGSWWVLQDGEYFTYFFECHLYFTWLTMLFQVRFSCQLIFVTICITVSYRYGFGYFKIFETSLDVEKSLLLILACMFVFGSTIVEGNLKLCLYWIKYTNNVQMLLLWLKWLWLTIDWCRRLARLCEWWVSLCAAVLLPC